jgi:WD40 repeat protein
MTSRQLKHLVVMMIVDVLVHPVSAADPIRRNGKPIPAGAVAQLGDGWLRHPSQVVGAAFAPDGKTLMTADLEAMYRWDLVSGRCKRYFPPNFRESVRALSFTPDGKTLFASGRLDDILALAPAAGFQKRFSLVDQDRRALGALHLWISKDGKTLVPMGSGSEIVLWSLESRKVRRHITRAALNSALGLTSDGKWIFESHKDGTIHVLDTRSGKDLRTMEPSLVKPKNPDARFIHTLAVSPDGRRLAILRGHQTVAVLSVATGKKLWSRKTSDAGLNHLAFAPDGKTLAVGSGQEFVLHDTENGTERRRFRVLTNGGSAPQFSPDGKNFAVTDGAGIHLWNVASGKPVRAAVGHTGTILSLFFLPQGKRLVSVSPQSEIILWDVAAGRELDRRPWVPGWGLVSLSKDGKTLRITENRDSRGSLASWPVGAGTRITRRDLEMPAYSIARLSPDGKMAVGMTSKPRLYLQDLGEGGKRRFLDAPSVFHQYLIFSPDSRLLAGAGQDGKVRIWSCASGKQLRELDVEKGPLPYIGQIAFSADGRSLIVVSTSMKIFEIATGKERVHNNKLPGARPVLTLSRDGQLVASPVWGGKVLVHSIVTGKQLAEFKTGQGEVWALDFSDDNRYLASGGTTGTVLLWKIPDRDDLPPLGGASEAAALWKDLGSADAARAYRALVRLATSPTHAVPLIMSRFQTNWTEPDLARITQLIADLDNDTFAVREKASRELLAAGSGAVGPLRKALAGKLSPEQKRRIRTLLAHLLVKDSEQLRSLRALEVLERIGTPAAKMVLRELVRKRLPGKLEEEVRASLQRLER